MKERIEELYKIHRNTFLEMENIFKEILQPYLDAIREARSIEEVNAIKFRANKHYSEIIPDDFSGSVSMLEFLDFANRKIRSLTKP